MLDRFYTLFKRDNIQTDTSDSDDVHIAAAALLVYAARIDGDLDARESHILSKLTAPHFGLSHDEAHELIMLAHQKVDEMHDLFQWTKQINAAFTYEHKLTLLEFLWQIILADGVVDAYETNLIRRISGLLYVTDKDAGLARKNAETMIINTRLGS